MHLYTNQVEATDAELQSKAAELFNNEYNFNTRIPIRITLSSLIEKTKENKKAMEDFARDILFSRKEGKVVIFVNDVSHQSLKDTLVNQLGQVNNSNEIALFADIVSNNTFRV